MLDKLNERASKAVSPALSTFLERLAYHQNVASFSVIYMGITSENVCLNWMSCFLVVISVLLVIPTCCMVFLSLFQEVIRMSMPNRMSVSLLIHLNL